MKKDRKPTRKGKKKEALIIFRNLTPAQLRKELEEELPQIEQLVKELREGRRVSQECLRIVFTI